MSGCRAKSTQRKRSPPRVTSTSTAGFTGFSERVPNRPGPCITKSG